MFALTKKTDYAIIALSHLAQHLDQVCTARDIAARFHVPPALLMNVLKTLSQSELVRSIRGAKGGYTLALPAERITLASIISAIEGPIRFVQCAGRRQDAEDMGLTCELVDVCPVTKPARKVHDKLSEFLRRVTLAEIAYDSDYSDRGDEFPSEDTVAKAETT